MSNGNERIAVIGLGYVGLPVAVALANKFDDVIGFDVSERRVEALQENHDWTGEIDSDALAKTSLTITADHNRLSDRTFFIVTVPTPIDEMRQPDLRPIESACALIGSHLRSGSVVVFESTVYPGVTDDVCAPLLEKASGLIRGRDFKLGYSPERINPGDRVHRLETITKVIAAEDDASLERLRVVYGAIIDAGLHIAPSIKVAEAAKVLENTQRDLNIALMNELSIILDKMGIRTRDVLEAAGTKWNFLPFSPGLVGGHCIGVDPYYLTFASQKFGYKPEVILSGRRINDGIGQIISNKAIKLLINNDILVKNAKVGILGLTFKENVPDIRNSKVPDIISTFQEYGLTPIVHDPLANHDDVIRQYSLSISDIDQFIDLDCVIIAVNHNFYSENTEIIFQMINKSGIIIDIKSMIDPGNVPDNVKYWSL